MCLAAKAGQLQTCTLLLRNGKVNISVIPKDELTDIINDRIECAKNVNAAFKIHKHLILIQETFNVSGDEWQRNIPNDVFTALISSWGTSIARTYGFSNKADSI